MRSRTLFRTKARTVLGAVTAIVLLAAIPEVRADDAGKILKSMSDYLAGQKTLSASFDSDIEVITPELQKIQFASSGEFKLSRPDKLRVKRTGGYADVDLVYDGKTISVSGNNIQSYVQAAMPGTVDQMVDGIQGRSGLGMPGMDLLVSNSFDELTANAINGVHVGHGVIDGVECEHLAFRTPDTDWQIWIEAGAKPVPRKYVITSKTVAGAPQYTLRTHDWKADTFADDTFTFKPPAGAAKVDLDSVAMGEFDELPPGTPQGAKK